MLVIDKTEAKQGGVYVIIDVRLNEQVVGMREK